MLLRKDRTQTQKRPDRSLLMLKITPSFPWPFRCERAKRDKWWPCSCGRWNGSCYCSLYKSRQWSTEWQLHHGFKFFVDNAFISKAHTSPMSSWAREWARQLTNEHIKAREQTSSLEQVTEWAMRAYEQPLMRIAQWSTRQFHIISTHSALEAKKGCYPIHIGISLPEQKIGCRKGRRTKWAESLLECRK